MDSVCWVAHYITWLEGFQMPQMRCRVGESLALKHAQLQHRSCWGIHHHQNLESLWLSQPKDSTPLKAGKEYLMKPISAARHFEYLYQGSYTFESSFSCLRPHLWWCALEECFGRPCLCIHWWWPHLWLLGKSLHLLSIFNKSKKENISGKM